ncbi:hypothetical protein [Burkholderia cenocepacia]|uniref:hypothetical protein n=1 Tax=Burkholderia cenocepacia TaxID=95486 RepID=UPI000A6AD306|nr:hypothetical protein [Burkholderia cenocepacia]
MNRIEFLTLQAQQVHTLSGQGLFDPRRGRTLMYGEDSDGCLRHTYLDVDGKICALVYAPISETGERPGGWAILAGFREGSCRNEDFVPSKRVFAVFTDFEFATRVLEAGVHFRLEFDDRSESSAHLYPPQAPASNRLRAIPGLVPPRSIEEWQRWVRERLGLEVAHFVSPSTGAVFVLEKGFKQACALLGAGEFTACAESLGLAA